MKDNDSLAKLIAKADSVAESASALVRQSIRDIQGEISVMTKELRIGVIAKDREKVEQMIQKRMAALSVRLNELMSAQNELAARAAAKSAGRLTGFEVKYDAKRAEAITALVTPKQGENLAAVFTDQMSAHAIGALRYATVKVMREQAVQGGSMKQMARNLEREWLKQAHSSENFQFKDAGGHVWDTRTYMQMNVRTNAMRVYNDCLVDDIAKATGGDLVRISTGGDPNCTLCGPWEGVIVSITGATKGLPTYDQARDAGCFHPNCIHTLEYVDEIADEKEIDLQKAHPVQGEEDATDPDSADERKYQIDQDRYRRAGMSEEEARIAVDRDNLEASIRAGLLREDARQIVEGMTDAQVTALCKDGNPPAFEPTKQATRADPHAADEKWAHGSRGGTVHIGRAATLERILEVCGVADVADEKAAWRPSNDAERSLHSFMQELGAEHEDRPQNALESNPHYGEGREYMVNCQRCVPTAEARLRGYDVEALPKPSGTDPMYDGVTPATADWLFPTFRDAKPIRYGRRSDIEKQMKEWGVGARAQIVCLNRGGRTAHTFYAVQGADGTHFYDPQTGSRDMSGYLDRQVAYRNKRSATFNQFARIDDLEFNEKVKLCCRASPKTAEWRGAAPVRSRSR
ncbi:MAG: phage minor capsid protein [Kiritimatiellia bacterium]